MESATQPEVCSNLACCVTCSSGVIHFCDLSGLTTRINIPIPIHVPSSSYFPSLASMLKNSICEHAALRFEIWPTRGVWICIDRYGRPERILVSHAPPGASSPIHLFVALHPTPYPTPYILHFTSHISQLTSPRRYR